MNDAPIPSYQEKFLAPRESNNRVKAVPQSPLIHYPDRMGRTEWAAYPTATQHERPRQARLASAK